MLSNSEAYSILASTKSWMLRNIFDWDCCTETNYWAVINDKDRDISELPSKVRNQIRRCLKDCEIRIISNKELIDFNGYQVFVKSFYRYKDVTVKIPDRKVWENGISEDRKSEFWGVFQRYSGLMIAYSSISRLGSTINYNTLKAIPDYLNKHYPYYGLLYEMNRHYLGEEKVDFVTDGFRSITNHSNIQPFLIKNFMFRKAYCRVKLYYKPWLKIAVDLAYPFRKIIPIKQIQHILNFEAINRGEI